MVASLALLSLSSSSFCLVSSLCFWSNLQFPKCEDRVEGTVEVAIPLTFSKLKAQPVEHQLMLIGQNEV